MDKQTRKACRKTVAYRNSLRHDPLQRRARMAAVIRQHEHNGRLFLEVWGRDCDLMERTELRTIDANVPALVSFENETANNAEGSWSISILSAEEAARFTASWGERAEEMLGY
jgi:hypothetical protein